MVLRIPDTRPHVAALTGSQVSGCPLCPQGGDTWLPEHLLRTVAARHASWTLEWEALPHTSHLYLTPPGASRWGLCVPSLPVTRINKVEQAWWWPAMVTETGSWE